MDIEEEVEEVQGLSPEKGPRFGDQGVEEEVAKEVSKGGVRTQSRGRVDVEARRRQCSMEGIITYVKNS